MLRLVILPMLAPLLVSCGAWSAQAVRLADAVVALQPPRPEGELHVQRGQRDRPSLRATLPYANGASLLGYGGVQLWARPERDELLVSAIVDAPAKEERWRDCRQAVVAIDGERIELTYIGAPLDGGGVYDAVRFDLRVDQVRRVARARSVRATVCGDPLELGPAQRRTLTDFVDWFDRLAAPAPHGEAPVYRDVGPELDVLPNEELDPGPHPA